MKLPACGRKGWTDSPYHTDGYMALTSWSVMFVQRFLSDEGVLCVAAVKPHPQRRMPADWLRNNQSAGIYYSSSVLLLFGKSLFKIIVSG